MVGAKTVGAVFGTPAAITFYHLDVLGSVRAVTGATAQDVITRHDYLAFGEDTAPMTGDPIRFTGKELDAETALQYFGGRYYRSVLGVFTSVDPIFAYRISYLDPQRWNRYAYARQNPLRYVDPDGKDLVLAKNMRRSDKKFVTELLTKVATRKGGREILTAVDGSATKIIIAVDSLNNKKTIEQARNAVKNGGTMPSLTFGELSNKTGQWVLTFDRKVMQEFGNLPPYKGAFEDTVVAGHELHHAKDVTDGKSAQEIKAGDFPTSSTGPAQQTGSAIAGETPDVKERDANFVVKWLLIPLQFWIKVP